jgi:SNF2 family DNA or RNA helicase
MRQIANHPALVEQGAVDSGKLEAFFDVLDEAIAGGHRSLVFSQFVSMLSILRRELEKRGVSYCYLDGSTKDRLGECRRFNQSDIPVFLISLHAGGTGLNLTGADTVIHFDPWWNPAVENQATDRAHRIGQKKTVCVVKLISEDSVEERVLKLQEKKSFVIDATVGATDDAIVSKMSFEDLKGLVGL